MISVMWPGNIITNEISVTLGVPLDPGTKPLARLWSVPAGFLFFDKMTFLDFLDM
jgi:hypothetical protein